MAYRRGPRQALGLFEARIVTDTDVERDCHRIVHTIGSAAFTRYDGNVARTFAEGSATCASATTTASSNGHSRASPRRRSLRTLPGRFASVRESGVAAFSTTSVGMASGTDS